MGKPVRSRTDASTRPENAGEKPVRRPRPPSDPNLVRDWNAMGSTRIVPDVASLSRRDTELLPEDTAMPTPWEEGGKENTVGEFKLLKKLGEGAMGAVFKAQQPSFNRTVALKVLFKQVGDNPKLVKRMYQEGLIMGRLDHPNIVCGYGVGEDKGWHYIAMEYVDGQNLAKWLSRVGTLSVGDALHVIILCARALQYAHKLELIHRDIKPDNVLITKEGDVKIADFGMVKALDADLSLTQTGHAVGTPWYMPLEQAKNAKDADARSDIYALGCTLYCMLTGNPPFKGKSIFEVLKAKEEASYIAARQINPEVPERLDLILAKMTAKHVKYRYQSCAEVIQDLEALDMANEELEFVKQAGKSSEHDTVAIAQKTMVTSQAFATVAAPQPVNDEWFVRFKNAAGQVIVAKRTTAEVLELIEDPQFDQTATASRKKEEGYRALATYKEFAPVLLGRVAKTSMDDRSSRFRNQYKKLEREAIVDRAGSGEHTPSAVANTFEYWYGSFLRPIVPYIIGGGIFLGIFFLAKWIVGKVI